MPDSQRKKPTFVIETRPRSSSEDSSAPSVKATSLKSPRTARFAEATAVNSPIEPKRLPFGEERTSYYMAEPQPSDVGFGYVNRYESVEMPDTDNNDYPSMPKNPMPKTPMPKTPLKSAMKTPGAPPRDFGNILSPTFVQEERLDKQEKHTDRRQAKDLMIKTRVRIAKFLLRGVNMSCSLIVLGMLASTFAIFNATKDIPARNSLPPWAEGQEKWPQITLLVISCVSLAICLIVMYGYWRGGHKRADRASIYYSAFTVGFFMFSIVMWGAGAGILQGAKSNSNNKDLWGWACVNNKRSQLFQNEVSYQLVCRMQNWSLVCCIIEVVVETITIAVYGIGFYRFYSKRQLRKSMAHRDRARSDLYLAQLRTNTVPNTPFAPSMLSPRDGGWKPPVDYYGAAPDVEDGVQYIDATAKSVPKPFQLQAPPIRIQGATPKMAQVGFTPVQIVSRDPSPTPPELDVDQKSPLMADIPRETQQEHFGAAPGEQVYDAVPIPDAYEAPLSPGPEPHHMDFDFR